MRVPCQAAPRCVTSQAGFEPALSFARSIRNLHHQRWSNRNTRQTDKKTLRRRLERRRHCEPLEVRSAIGIRLSPRSLRQAPRAWAARVSARAPGSGSPVPACAGMFRMSRASDNKKPSGAVGSGGSVAIGLSMSPKRDRSHEPGILHRSAESRSIVRRAFEFRIASRGSCWFANPMFARPREIRPRPPNVNTKIEPTLRQRRDKRTRRTLAGLRSRSARGRRSAF